MILFFEYLAQLCTHHKIPIHLTHKTFFKLDVFIHPLYFGSGDDDQSEDDFIIFNEANKTKESKTKIKMFAELMVPKFLDKEFKSHFRLDRRSVQVCYLSLSSNV